MLNLRLRSALGGKPLLWDPESSLISLSGAATSRFFVSTSRSPQTASKI